MNKNNLKFTVFGVILGVATVIGLAAQNSHPDEQVGRYQIAIGGNLALTCVLDTATGQVWERNDPEYRNPKLKR